jgi:VCBS repeat-containing protein
MNATQVNISKIRKRNALVFLVFLVLVFLSTGPAFSVTLGNVTITYLGRQYFLPLDETRFQYRVDSDPQGNYWILEMESCIQESDLGPMLFTYEWVTTPIRGIKMPLLSTIEFFTVILEGEWPEWMVDVGAEDHLGVFRSESDAIEGPHCNQAPVAVNDTYGPITELQTLHEFSPGVLENDTDYEGDPFTVYRVNGSTGNVGSQITLPSGALLTVLSTGEFIYDPNGAFWDLQDGAPDSDSFTYTAYDGMDESNTATVSITITGVDTLMLTAGPDTVDFGSIPGPGSYSESSSHLEVTSDDNWSVSDNILWSDPGTSFPAGADQATVQKVFSLDYNPKTGSPGESLNVSVVYYLDIENSDMPGLPPGSYSIVVLYTATHTGP